MSGGSLGEQQEMRSCLMPKSWYEKDDPCSTGEWLLNGPGDRLGKSVDELKTNVKSTATTAASTMKYGFYIALALLVAWFVLRGYEAYKR